MVIGVQPEMMRVSDAERAAVVDILSQAATDGRLTLEEYSERAATAYAAKTRADLEEVVDDLPHGVLPGSSLEPSPEPSAPRPMGAPTRPTLPEVDSHRLVAFLGNESRKGRWIVPERMTVESYLGDCHLELQEALLEHPVTTIDARVILGSVTIFVPDGVDVRLSGRAVLGSKESKLRGTPRPGAPVVHVRCDVLLGSVTVRPPRWHWQLGQRAVG